ncbi:MAG: winged helix-turn-helix domain-containing protein [Candidatus Pacearchaeota archaeon]|jgi:DNA-binding transcriptional ArsR family regulator
MSNKKYIMVSLDDEKLGVLAEVLSNKTAKKIIEFLADREASESEISQDLKLPANTVNYNVKKLLEAGLIEKSGNYLWSLRGKKIIKYRVAKKSIIISPKSSNVIKVVSTVLITGIAAVLVKVFGEGFIQKGADVPARVDMFNYANQTAGNLTMADAAGLSQEAVKCAPADIVAGNLTTAATPTLISQPWLWFVVGALVLGVVYLVLSNVKLKRK